MTPFDKKMVYIFTELKKKIKPNMFGFEALHPIHDDRSIAPQSLFLCHAWSRFLSAMYLTVIGDFFRLVQISLFLFFSWIDTET